MWDGWKNSEYNVFENAQLLCQEVFDLKIVV